MSKFKSIPSKIGDLVRKNRDKGDKYEKNLENQQKELQKMIEEKQFIKRNVKQVLELSKQTTDNRKTIEQLHKQIKQKEDSVVYGKLPKYLLDKRAQEEVEKQQTLKEIAMNKRPPGTRILDDNDKNDILDDLLRQEENLKQRIERVCISQVTLRAKNEYKSLFDQSYYKNRESIQPPQVEWVCTIFSVFLCSQCAGLHRKLGRQLSEIKSMRFLSPYASQAWTERELRQLTLTEGNVGFRDFILPYNINFDGIDKQINKRSNMNSSSYQDDMMMPDTLSIEDARQQIFEQSADDDRLATFEDSQTEYTVLQYRQGEEQFDKIVQIALIDPNDAKRFEENMQNRFNERGQTVKISDMDLTNKIQIEPSDVIPKKSMTSAESQKIRESSFFGDIFSKAKNVEKVIDKSVEGLKKMEIKEFEKSMVSKGRQLFSKFF
ncbi:ap-domain-containing protein [Stylonychia lemnae]|uniref:Ap-domain-containing protein n=1 Tax=Stylonychia lemnae TaxID=5949 RepID=A0A077ZVW0_STYLE|nr:ap-domain-containing protein [Stylonychia lemnae]|eukprot:CDW74090.1 ap-domain-containing protein [Stylonychia lemnae]